MEMSSESPLRRRCCYPLPPVCFNTCLLQCCCCLWSGFFWWCCFLHSCCCCCCYWRDCNCCIRCCCCSLCTGCSCCCCCRIYACWGGAAGGLEWSFCFSTLATLLCFFCSHLHILACRLPPCWSAEFKQVWAHWEWWYGRQEKLKCSTLSESQKQAWPSGMQRHTHILTAIAWGRQPIHGRVWQSWW